MKSFFKVFLASLLAFVVFCFLLFVVFVGMAGSAISKSAPPVGDNAVLQIDLSNQFEERPQGNFNALLQGGKIAPPPSLFDVIRLIEKAKTDDKIKGIYLIANGNTNGFAASEELRAALQDFKLSKKFIIAHGDVMTQKAYGLANIADKVYVSPQGYFEWFGYSVNYLFLKGTLDKLDIKPQVFYAGKFKSATEPLRFDKMSEANKLQTTVWVNDLYQNLLQQTATVRKIDTATLHKLANEGSIQTPQHAVQYKLIDGVKYDDEIKDEIKKKLSIEVSQKINFVSIDKYAQSFRDFGGSGDDIAVIYASGDIVDGKGEQDNIGSTTYIDLLRKARLDKNTKAIVLRVNSGGGSALASENIWRELYLAKKVKPVIVSFGDVAASGGYYIACVADSIFASPTTITGSIGVFGIIPDMSAFFKNKLGVTFDGVQTGPLANAGSVNQPMMDKEKIIVQNGIDRIYAQFKSRVAEGRKRDTAYIETIAQGRVWSGMQAKQAGLIDAHGGLQRAIKAAAAKANLKEYEVKEYPAKGGWLKQLLGMDEDVATATKIKSELGEEYFLVYQQIKKVKQMCNTAQARLPFDFVIK